MLELKNIYKTYRTKDGVTHRALNNVSLSFEEKGLVFIVGKSGGGKTTLLNIIGALDNADRGEIILEGNSFTNAKPSDLDKYRNTYISVVYQEYNLLPTLKIKENIAFSLRLQSNYSEERVKHAMDVLKISDLADRIPNQLSGGQSQRVAIARAIVKNPKIILADEPTGNLDNHSGLAVMNIFKELAKEKLVIVVTHDKEIAETLGDRIIEVADGKIIKDLKKEDNLISESVEIVGNTLLKIPKNNDVPTSVLDQVNDILFTNDRDSYLIREENIQKVKSLNQHIKDAVEINPDGNATYFTQYRPVKSKSGELALKNVSMPLSAGFRLALSTFKYKKIRLMLTVAMLVISLFMCALLSNFSFFDKNHAISKSMVSDDIANYVVTKNELLLANSSFSDEEVKRASKYSSKIAKGYKKDMTILDPLTSAPLPMAINSIKNSFSGFFEVDDVTALGFEYVAGNIAPSGEDITDIVITTFMIDEMQKLGCFPEFANQPGYGSYIGKKIHLDFDTFTIIGIIRNPTADKITSVLVGGDSGQRIKQMAGLEVDNNLSMIFCKEDMIKELLNSKSFFNVKFKLLNATRSLFDIKNVTTESRLQNETIYKMEGNFKQDSIYITDDDYKNLFSGAPSAIGENGELTDLAKLNITEFNGRGLSGALKHNITSDYINHIFSGLEIAGVFTYTEDEDAEKLSLKNLIIVNEDIFTAVSTSQLGNNMLMAKTAKSVSKNSKALDYFTKNNCAVLSSSSIPYGSNVLISDESKYVLTVLMIVFMALAAVLMYSFIRSSIKMESRQIGIIRGLGARGIDTYKIFAIEGLIISTFSIIITLIAYALFTLTQVTNYSYHTYVYLFSPWLPFVLIAMGLLITTLGSILPLIKLVKMSPTDAMYKGNLPK